MDRKLGQILMDRKVITPLQVEYALQNQRLMGCLIGRVFILLDMCSIKDIDRALLIQIKDRNRIKNNKERALKKFHTRTMDHLRDCRKKIKDLQKKMETLEKALEQQCKACIHNKKTEGE